MNGKDGGTRVVDSGSIPYRQGIPMNPTAVNRLVCLLSVALAPAARAQVLINEVHGAGQLAQPALPGDYLELWNRGTAVYDLSGHTISVWTADSGALTSVVVPNTGAAGRHLVDPGCFWVFQESPLANLGGALTGALAGLRGMRGLPSTWVSAGSLGCRITDPGGACVAYVYLRRALTAAPAPPFLLPPCTWVSGNIAPSGNGEGHLQRLTNADTGSYADWGQDATTNPGTPGAPNTTGAASQTPVTPPRWEMNSAGCHLDVDGATNDGQAPIRVRKCVGTTAVINVQSTLAGHGWEIGTTPALGQAGIDVCSGSGGGGVNTAGGQVLNLNVAAPGLVLLNGLLLPPFPGNIALPFSLGAPLANLSGQMIVIDGAHPDGWQLSALVELGFDGPAPLSVSVAGPATDDGFVAVPVGCFPFYGRAYSQVFVNANARITMNHGSTDFLPWNQTAVSGDPFLGAWCDLSPNLGGTITVTSPTPTSFRVDYNAVPYFNAIGANTFAIVLDAATGAVTLTGLGGFGPNLDLMFLGLSRGEGATDPGPAVFAIGGPNAPANATDMIYEFGPEGSLAPGVATLTFLPLATGPAAGNYAWTGF